MPARPLEQIVRDTLGNQSWEIVQLVAKLEAAETRIVELTAELALYKPPEKKAEQ